MAAGATTENSGTMAWEKAYDAIKEKILSLDIKPGETVSEPNLARELGISRTPIREALKQLEQEGLIVTENRRKRVYILRINEIHEIFELKTAIEGKVIRLAAERATSEQKVELRGIIEEMRTFREQEQLENLRQGHQAILRWMALDGRFHAALFTMSRNRKAETIIGQLNFQWHRLELGLLAMEGRLEQNIAEHLEMGAAVLEGRSAEAEALLVRHLEKLHVTIVNIMEIFHYPV